MNLFSCTIDNRYDGDRCRYFGLLSLQLPYNCESNNDTVSNFYQHFWGQSGGRPQRKLRRRAWKHPIAPSTDRGNRAHNRCALASVTAHWATRLPASRNQWIRNAILITAVAPLAYFTIRDLHVYAIEFETAQKHPMNRVRDPFIPKSYFLFVIEPERNKTSLSLI